MGMDNTIAKRVKSFLLYYAWDKERLVPDLRLSEVNDMDRVAGEVFMEDFCEEFPLNLSEFKAERHFHAEPTLEHQKELRFLARFSTRARDYLTRETTACFGQLEDITLRSLVASAEQKKWVRSGVARQDYLSAMRREEITGLVILWTTLVFLVSLLVASILELSSEGANTGFVERVFYVWVIASIIIFFKVSLNLSRAWRSIRQPSIRQE